MFTILKLLTLTLNIGQSHSLLFELFFSEELTVSTVILVVLKKSFASLKKLTHFYCLFNILLRVLSRSDSFFFKDYFEAKLI